MVEHNKMSYIFYVIAPFNTRMVFNNLNLIGKYEDIRKGLFKKLNEKYPNQVLIEKLGTTENASEDIQIWLGEKEKIVEPDEDIRLFKGTGGSGVTQKDKSIITMVMNKEFELTIDVLGHDIFISAPKIIFESNSILIFFYFKLIVN